MVSESGPAKIDRSAGSNHEYGQLPRADAVVLSALVRTQCGRHVRSLCDAQHPWLPCSGRVKQSFLMNFKQATAFVAERREALACPLSARDGWASHKFTSDTLRMERVHAVAEGWYVEGRRRLMPPP